MKDKKTEKTVFKDVAEWREFIEHMNDNPVTLVFVSDVKINEK